MEGGSGHFMARFGFLLMVIAAPGFVTEGGLQMGAAEAASLGSLQTAQTLFAAGGAIGAVIRYGVARGVFSNEAGMGSAPIAAAAAKTDHPALGISLLRSAE